MKPRLCYVVSSLQTATAFLAGHIRAAAEHYEISVVANAPGRDALREAGVPAEVTPVAIERRIAPFADLAALWVLWRQFRRARPDLVHSVTPKAGLLAMLAARLAGVPVRIHSFTGQVWATRRGAMRALLKFLDGVTAACATNVLADSASQRQFLVDEGVVAAGRIQVLAQGSICGVDGVRFRPDSSARAQLRAELGVPADAVLFLYLGRFTRDKGLPDLARAFEQVPDAWLLLVGPDEERLAEELRAACGPSAARLRIAGHTNTPERAMAAADVFVLPSYREGFGSSVIEAAAAGLPAIATRIYGLTDAVVHERTGYLVEPRDADALAACMRGLAADAGRRRALGEAARERAARDFTMEAVTRALLDFYAARLAKARADA